MRFRKQVAKWTPHEVERVTGLPEAQVKHIAELFAKEKPATLIWAMGQTQFTTGTANVRASCILLLATGNVGSPGVAPTFSAATPMCRAPPISASM